ncbi:MAG: hypothetical protein KGJ06_02120 [Pseudomonadota bacterium]|nr:hypothetical protein [Pseudomonadota bacterium]
MEGVVTGAITGVLSSLSTYMAVIVAAAFVLAIAIFGMHILSGEREIIPKMTGFVLRLAICGAFSASLGAAWFPYPGGLVQATFDINNQMITWVAGGYSPWAQLDSALGTLLGFAPGVLLLNGVIGILLAALFSPWLGFMLFFSGISALIDMLLFIFDIVYTDMLAVIVIAFQLILSCFIVPLGVFSHAERYVKQWLHMLVAAMLVRVLLFAFLSICLGLITSYVAQVFSILGGNDFSQYWVADRPFFGWTMPSDPNFIMNMAQQGTGGLFVPPISPTVNPFAQNESNANVIYLPALNFGANSWNIIQSLVAVFIMLWVFVHFMRSIIEHIPSVANGIAGAASGLAVQSSPLSQGVKSVLSNINSKVGKPA